MLKAEQMKNLVTGKGIWSLLEEGFKVLGNPIATFDTDYNLMVRTEASVDDRFWNELTTTGTFGMEAQKFFMDEYFTDVVANAEKITMMRSSKLKYDRILGHIFNGNGIKVANVLMIGSNEAIDDDMIAAFEVLTDLLTEEIRDDAFYIAYGEAYQNSWIKKLIDYDIEEKGLYSPHLQILYNGLKANLYVAVVDIAASKAGHDRQEHYVNILRQKRKDFRYAIYDSHIVMIMSTNYKLFSAKRDLSDLADYFEQENMFLGISSYFDNLFELRKYYAEAIEAIKRMKPNDTRHVFIHGRHMD